MRLPAGPLQIFIKPYTEQEMLPQNLTILCEVVLKILSKENRKRCAHLYTHMQKKCPAAGFQGAEEKWGNIFYCQTNSQDLEDPYKCP